MILPADWETLPLEEVARCQGGLAFSPDLQGRREGELPFYKVSDMNLPDNQWLMVRANNYVTAADRQAIGGDPKPARAVIFPKVGAAIHTNKKRLLASPAYIDNNVMAVWTRDEHRCLPEFLYAYFLRSSLSDLAAPGPLPSITNTRVLSQSIALPPLEEQKLIASLLAQARAAIDVEERLLASVAEFKKAKMAELFSRGLGTDGQRDTEIGRIPESWDVVPLGRHLLKAQYGLSIKGQREGQYPILRMNCQVDGRVVFRDLQYVDLDIDTFGAFRLEPGDLLFNRTNSFELVGRMAILEESRDAVFASYLIRLSVDRSVLEPAFVNYYFNQRSVQADLKRLASKGVSQANISASKLRDYSIPKPPSLQEQREIVSILTAVDRKLHVHQRRRALMNELFNTLLDDLMTGRRRVADMPSNVAAVAS